MAVGLDHLGKEVVGSADGDFGLDEDTHALHHVLARHIVKCDFPLDVLVDLQGANGRISWIIRIQHILSGLLWIIRGDRHMFRERNTPLLLDQSCRLQPIVKTLLHLMEPLL